MFSPFFKRDFYDLGFVPVSLGAPEPEK